MQEIQLDTTRVRDLTVRVTLPRPFGGVRATVRLALIFIQTDRLLNLLLCVLQYTYTTDGNRQSDYALREPLLEIDCTLLSGNCSRDRWYPTS